MGYGRHLGVVVDCELYAIILGMRFFYKRKKLWTVIVIIASISLVLSSVLPFVFR